MPCGPIDCAWAARLVESFHSLHERLYTFAQRTQPVEAVTLRLRASGLSTRSRCRSSRAPRAPRLRRMSIALFDSTRRATTTCPVYRRETLLAGHCLRGPAVVDQLDTTSLVFPEQSAQVDRYGNLIVLLT